MTIYFAGNEPDSFTLIPPATMETVDTDTYDSGFVRGSIKFPGGIGGAIGELPSEFGANSADGYWIGFRYAYDYGNAINADLPLVMAFDEEGKRSAILSMSNGSLGATLFNSSGGSAFQWASLGLPVNKVVSAMDFHVYTSAGDIKAELYLNGEKGSTMTYAANTNVGVKSFQIMTGTSHTIDVFFSEIIFADEDTRNFRVRTLAPSADGNYTSWSGTYDDIDDIESTGGLQATAVNDQQSYQTAGLTGVQSSWPIKAVCMSAKVGSNGTNDLQFFMRKSSTDYLSSSLGAGPNSLCLTNVWNADPSTASAWTSQDMTDWEFGVKSVT